MKFSLVLLCLCALVSLVSCKSVEMEMNLRADRELPFFVRSDEGWRELRLSQYNVRIHFASSSRNLSKIEFRDPLGNQKTITVRARLPKRDDFLHVIDPLYLSAQEIEQNFSLLITREVDLREDHIGVSFLNRSGEVLLASAEFNHQSTRPAFDESSGEFLRSYQQVRYRQRAAMIPIDAGLDGVLGEGRALRWASQSLNAVTNFGGALLLAPWAYARYRRVEWVLGDRINDAEALEQRWSRLLHRYPVVDYFAFTHSGDDEKVIAPLDSLPKKQHQLRLTYSSACYSAGSTWALTRYNSAIGVGHYETSASPLFSFSFFRNWVYGRSTAEASRRAWVSGQRRARLLEFVSFARLWQDKHGLIMWSDTEDLIQQSEMMLSWTDGFPPTHLFVHLSAVPERSQAEFVPYESLISGLETKLRGRSERLMAAR